jgi:tRNA (guanine-N7-)-methyltransferase
LQSAATAVPDHNFLGIEIAHKYARFSAARLAKHALSNAIVVDGDGQRLFAELLPNNSLAAVHVYFPDPWWKKRHHKRRVMNERFVQAVGRTLEPGGALHFWTDVREYFDATRTLIASERQLTGPFDIGEQLAEHDLDYRTHFERRMRLRGEPVYRARFDKQ